MKKAVFAGIVAIVVLVGLNVYYYIDIYKWQLNYQSRMMEKQLELVVGHISDFFAKTQINAQFLLSPDDVDLLFDNKWMCRRPLERIEMLYDRYGENLHSLSVCDLKGNYYKIMKGNGNSFVTEYGKEDPQEHYRPSIWFSLAENQIIYFQPLIHRNDIYGYAKFGIDIKGYFNTTLQHFYFSDVNYQYVLMPNSTLVYYRGIGDTFNPALSPELLANIDNAHSFVHKVKIDDKEIKVLSSIKRKVLNGSTYYVGFAIPHKELTSNIIRNSFLVGLITLVVVVMLVLAYLYSVRKRTKQEEQARHSQETLRQVLYYLPVAVVSSDHKNIIRQVNKTAVELFGLGSEDELAGTTFAENNWFEGKSVVSRSQMSSTSIRYRIIDKDGGEQVIINERIPFFFNDECQNIDVFFEISNTGYKNNNASLNEEMRNNFMANISHELRTPLNGIMGMAEILNKMQLHDDERDILGVIRGSANTLLTLINDILDFSKITAGKFHVDSVPFDLGAEIEDVIATFQKQVRQKKIKLKWNTSIPLPIDFLGDPIRFRQVLINLISNAIKFTIEGEIVLHVCKGKLFNGNEAIQFEVHDSGIGIREEKINHIFEPFWQVDGSSTRRFGGTGLGASIAKQLVELMGGQIQVISPSSISRNPKFPGSSFMFTLPHQTRTLMKNINTSNIQSVAEISVAVITDDIKNIQPLAENLRKLNVKWIVMDASLSSVSKLHASNEFQMIIIDNRPDFDGLMFLHTLHSQKIDLRYLILVQTSDGITQSSNVLKRMGADAYLKKPLKPSLLREFIMRYFNVNIPEIETNSDEDMLRMMGQIQS